MGYEAVADALAERGWAEVPNFLNASEVKAFRELATKGRAEFRPAGIGRGEARQVNAEIRSDLIQWLDDGPAASKLDALKHELNRSLFLGLKEFEGHLALYPPGARYQKHVDNFRGTSPRVLSCVLYLNDSWTPADEGELRLYDKDDQDRVVVDIAPRSGTLACFLSRDVPHEVLPTKRERLSFTGWFRDR